MSEAADDEVRPMLQASKGAPDELTELGNVARQRVFHDALDPGIAGLLGIEVRGVGRQLGHREVVRMSRQKGSRAAGAMGVQPVPDDQEGPADLAPEVPQGPDHHPARDAAADVPGVQLPRRGHRDHAGHLAPLAQPPQHRGHAAPGPGRPWTGPEAVSGFVKEDDGAPLAAGPLF